MPYIISGLVFIFISILSIPSTWFESNVVRKKLNNAPKYFNLKGKLSIRRLTPLVINMMTLLNINISVEKHERIETNLQSGGQEGKLSVEDFITMNAVLGLVLP